MILLSDVIKKIKKSHLQIAGVAIVILLAVCLLWFNNATSVQADLALVADVYFDGEYRIEGGDWHKISADEHISATKGDVTLRGNFHMLDPEGGYVGIYRGEIPIAFYLNHINLTIIDDGEEPFVLDTENRVFGSSECGVAWTAHCFYGEFDDATRKVEIIVHNPHAFGNENAIDEMLSNIAFWTGTDFEKGILNSGEPQRNTGVLLVLISVVFLGIALFSALIHIKNTKIIWLTGLVVMFAGLFFTFNTESVSFWNASITSNTTVLGFSMMLYMLFLLMSITYYLNETKLVGKVTVIAVSVVNIVLFVLPMITDILFYDTWSIWAMVQIAANTVLAVCLVNEFLTIKKSVRWIYVGAIIPLIAFFVDFVGVWLGFLELGIVSRFVFIILLAVAAIMVLRLIPYNINAATKAKELEMEKVALGAQLAESRVSTMISQIRPHFIYNTLGSIEQLCKLDPPKAGDLVHNFAKYLRGNFGELDNPKPILMSKEMEHVHHYISIENVRFPDMTFTFEMNSDDFEIPALTVQPIVENAIKHGLMKLQRGGTINVVSYETDTDYCVSVTDNGVGFDTGMLFDDRKHVGLRNIRERLKVMVNGTLEIESTVGVGTKVLVKIPKEVE